MVRWRALLLVQAVRGCVVGGTRTLSEVRNNDVVRRWRVVEGGPPVAEAVAGGRGRGPRQVAVSLFVPSTLVAPEYGRYQVWHVVQDLSTQLRGTLATSAVFAGLGLGGGPGAARSALAATTAWLARDASGMVASLAATSSLAPRLNGDARRWRFFGDLCVDVALFLELATPHAPRACFLPLLCVSSVLKALCGVTAGGANAAIAAHWATTSGDYAEVSAKGAAIGTVSGLAGLGLSLVATCALQVRQGTLLSPRARAVASAGLYAVLTALHVVACGRGLKVLALDKIGCRRRFDALADAFDASGSAPSPRDLAALDAVAGLPDAGASASDAARLVRAWAADPERVAAVLPAVGSRRKHVAVPGARPLLALLDGATPRDERRALLHRRALDRTDPAAFPLDPDAFAAAVARLEPTEAALDAFDAALAHSGYDLDARVLPADDARLRLA